MIAAATKWLDAALLPHPSLKKRERREPLPFVSVGDIGVIFIKVWCDETVAIFDFIFVA